MLLRVLPTATVCLQACEAYLHDAAIMCEHARLYRYMCFGHTDEWQTIVPHVGSIVAVLFSLRQYFALASCAPVHT